MSAHSLRPSPAPQAERVINVEPGSAFRLYARATAGFEARLQDTLAQLRTAAQAHPGHIVQATSLGAEDMVITDLISRHQLPVAVAFLDTGVLHERTLALIGAIEARYDRAIEVYRPDPSGVAAFVAEHGDQAMYRSQALRKACCSIRKLAPLQALLQERSAWITGLRRSQSDARTEVRDAEVDAQGRIKFNPLAAWSWNDVWHYIRLHQVPYNALHDAFMPSIGCAPCTRAISVGEDIRAGRWWWEQDTTKECGLHAPSH